MKVRLLLLPDGSVKAVYDDLLAQLNLGPITHVERASNVEFNVATQQWEARDAKTGAILASHPLRNACVELEKEKVHQQLVAQHSVVNAGTE